MITDGQDLFYGMGKKEPESKIENPVEPHGDLEVTLSNARYSNASCGYCKGEFIDGGRPKLGTFQDGDLGKTQRLYHPDCYATRERIEKEKYFQSPEGILERREELNKIKDEVEQGSKTSLTGIVKALAVTCTPLIGSIFPNMRYLNQSSVAAWCENPTSNPEYEETPKVANLATGGLLVDSVAMITGIIALTPGCLPFLYVMSTALICKAVVMRKASQRVQKAYNKADQTITELETRITSTTSEEQDHKNFKGRVKA